MNTFLDKFKDIKIKVIKYCPICNKRQLLSLSKYRFDAYESGESIDIAFSNVPIYVREIIDNGTCRRCQKEY